MNKNNRPVMVTIRCITYNHERFIRQCLDGFVMQKTSFRYEIVIHDDASTDRTADIIREYTERYPELFIPIFEKENQYNNWDYVVKLINENIHGKYIAMCEGDDYWIDPLKLQKQVDFLEAHPECTLALSNGFGYYENKKKLVMLNPIPTNRSKLLSMSEVLREEGGLVPTASMCYRREMAETEPDWCLNAPVGDRPLRMWCAINGKVYYDINPMVVYRKSISGSFSQRVHTDFNYARHILDDMNVFFDAFDNYTHDDYHDDVQYMKEREEYYFFCRTGDYNLAFHSDYFKRYSVMEQLIIRLRITLNAKTPKLYNILSNIKKFVCKN